MLTKNSRSSYSYQLKNPQGIRCQKTQKTGFPNFNTSRLSHSVTAENNNIFMKRNLLSIEEYGMKNVSAKKMVPNEWVKKKHEDEKKSKEEGYLVLFDKNSKYNAVLMKILVSPEEPEINSPSINANSDTRFPSTLLANSLRTGVIARAKSYQSIGILKEGSVINELYLETSDLKAIIESAFKQTISTLASIAAQQKIDKVQISQDESLTEIFEDLLKQYFPPISSEAFCSIEPILIRELISELDLREFAVDSGKLLFENENLFIRVKRDYSLPGLLATDESDFLVASDI